MSELIQSLKNKVPNHSKAVEWIKLISITGSAQIFIQFINLLSGILIIRLLPVKEYALYTLANAMLGTMTVLADGGISTGVLSQGGKIWNDKKKLGSVIVTGLALRKKFAIVSLIIATPILAYLLKHNGASWLTTILIICALVPAFFAALSDSLLEVAPKLHQNIPALQKNQILASLSRFIIISSSLILFPFTSIALLGNGITRMWANIRLRKISSRHADYEQDFDPKIEKEIITIVKRSVPEMIYYCLSGQISIWLISFFGSTKAIAQIGALGRLSVVLTLFSTMVTTLVVPRFSRLERNYKILLKRFVQIQVLVLVLCFFIISISYFFPSEILWVLGKRYSGLNEYLILTFVGSCLSLIIGISFSLYASRGWIINPLFSIPFNIGTLIAGIALFNVSTLYGVLALNIFVGVVQAIMHIAYAVIKILKLKEG